MQLKYFVQSGNDASSLDLDLDLMSTMGLVSYIHLSWMQEMN